MKKFILACLFLVSAFSFSLEKSGIKEYDSLVISKGKIIGMAGASADSTTFWQIGINTEKEAEGRGIASLLVKILKEDIEKLGKVPYYGTSMSNLVSQRVAANAGFKPAWVELLAERI